MKRVDVVILMDINGIISPAYTRAVRMRLQRRRLPYHHARRFLINHRKARLFTRALMLRSIELGAAVVTGAHLTTSNYLIN